MVVIPLGPPGSLLVLGPMNAPHRSTPRLPLTALHLDHPELAFLETAVLELLDLCQPPDWATHALRGCPPNRSRRRPESNRILFPPSTLNLHRLVPNVRSAEAALIQVKDAPMPERPIERRSLRTWVQSVYMVLVFGGFLSPSAAKPPK